MTSSVGPTTYETTANMPRTTPPTERGCMKQYTVPTLNKYELNMFEDMATAKKSLRSHQFKHFTEGLEEYSRTSMRVVAFAESYNSCEKQVCQCRKRNLHSDLVCVHLNSFDSKRIVERASEGFCLVCGKDFTYDGLCAHRQLHKDCEFLNEKSRFYLPNPGHQATHMVGRESHTKLLEIYVAQDEAMAKREENYVSEPISMSINRREARISKVEKDKIDAIRGSYLHDVQVAFLMGEHERLGEKSMVSELKSDSVKLIMTLFAHMTGLPPVSDPPVSDPPTGEPIDLE